MTHWLAEARRDQEIGELKRFAAPYWTVDFPRPMMACVVTQGADGLRVDAVFHGSGDLAGLIWESEDRWDHPLLRYTTVRDYAHCTLRFRWRSGGVKPLDAIDGPTLTIEGAMRAVRREAGMCGCGTMPRARPRMPSSPCRSTH